MNKGELVAVLAKKTNLSKHACEKVLDEFKKVTMDVCLKGEEINLRNFCTFKMQERKQRKYLNPQTKRHYFSPPKKMITCKVHKNFKYPI